MRRDDESGRQSTIRQAEHVQAFYGPKQPCRYVPWVRGWDREKEIKEKASSGSQPRFALFEPDWPMQLKSAVSTQLQTKRASSSVLDPAGTR